MFGNLFKRKDDAAVAHQGAATNPAPRGPALMRAIRDEVRAAAIDHEDLARAVLADIRAEQLDVAYDVTDIDDWIGDYVARAGLSTEDLNFERVRATIKAQPGVTYKQRGIRVEDRFAGLRARIKRRRGHVPEKVWVFLISMDGYALRQSPERCNRVLIEGQAEAARLANPTRAVPPPISRRLGADSEPIPQAAQRFVADRMPIGRRAVAA